MSSSAAAAPQPEAAPEVLPRPVPPEQVVHVRRVVPSLDVRRLLYRHREPDRWYWPVAGVLALLALGGLAALVVKVLGGPEPRVKWGYPAAALAFLLSSTMAAPPLALASRLGRGYWGVPLRRTADLLGLSGVAAVPLALVLLWALPDWRDRPSIWQGWPGAPGLWDGVAFVLLAALGIALAYTGALPDLAILRDLQGTSPPAPLSTSRRGRAGGTTWRDGRRGGEVVPHVTASAHRWTNRLALGWRGSERQWAVLRSALVVLSGFYLMLYVFVSLLAISDLAMSLVPRWASADMPPYHAVTGLEGGVAATLVVLAVLRRVRRLDRFVEPDTFKAGSKILLALALLWFYFFWAEFLTYWYGRMPEEQQLLRLLMFGPYLWAFVAAFLCSFVLPVALLIWNPVRARIGGVAAAAAIALLGLLLDRVRLYVGAWSVAGPVRDVLDQVPPPHPPGVSDVLILVGFSAAALLLPLLALRLAPAVSLWEHEAQRLLKSERTYLKTTVPVIAKAS